MKSKQKLSEVIQVNPSRPLKKNNYAPFVSMDNIIIHQRKISKFSKRRVSSSKTTFKNGDVLLAKITPSLENGKTAFVDILKENEIGHGSTEFFVLSGKENVTLNLFVYYIMRTSEFRQKAIQSMTGTSGRQRVQQTVFDDFEINLPSIPIQEKICSILGGLDKKIILLQNQNKTLEKITQTIFKSWFIDFDGVTEFDNSELGKIPKGWKVEHLVDNCDIVTGKLNSNASVEDGEYSFFTCAKENFKTNTYSFDCEAILLAGNNAIGDFSVKYFSGKFDVYQRTYVITLKNSNSFSYFYLLLSIKMALEYFQSISYGTATKYLTMTILEPFPILIPDVDSLKIFNQTTNQILKLITKNNSELEILTKTRDILLPKLMSGEIRV